MDILGSIPSTAEREKKVRKERKEEMERQWEGRRERKAGIG